MNRGDTANHWIENYGEYEEDVPIIFFEPTATRYANITFKVDTSRAIKQFDRLLEELIPDDRIRRTDTTESIPEGDGESST